MFAGMRGASGGILPAVSTATEIMASAPRRRLHHAFDLPENAGGRAGRMVVRTRAKV
jgi:hypothetical protein